MTETPGTLAPTEYHPAADSALAYLRTIPFAKLLVYAESFASCAIEDNRLAVICGETLWRLLDGKPVSDRYLLGLAWMIKQGEEG